MTAVVDLVLPFPPSANRYWRSAPGRGMVPSSEALEYKRRLAILLGGRLPLVGKIRGTTYVHRPRAVGDLKNVDKVLDDAVEGFLWLDDKQIVDWRMVLLDERPGGLVRIHAEGERFALPEEAHAHREAKVARNEKRKATVKKNRAAKELTQIDQLTRRATPASYPAGRKP